ncbi:hypothetical protein AVS7_03422 [Acidovorax sp. MR-S7]|nr:hypothetical protein AVS7_03422 [Acidovorax sp. MR-S7]
MDSTCTQAASRACTAPEASRRASAALATVVVTTAMVVVMDFQFDSCLRFMDKRWSRFLPYFPLWAISCIHTGTPPLALPLTEC